MSNRADRERFQAMADALARTDPAFCRICRALAEQLPEPGPDTGTGRDSSVEDLDSHRRRIRPEPPFKSEQC